MSISKKEQKNSVEVSQPNAQNTNNITDNIAQDVNIVKTKKEKKQPTRLELNAEDKKKADYGITHGYLNTVVVANVEKLTVNHSRFGMHLIEKYHFVNSELVDDKDGIFIYKDGYLQSYTSEQINGLIRKYLPSTLETKKTVAEIMEKILVTSYVPKFHKKLTDIDNKYLNLNNGLLNLETFELEPHCLEKASITRFDVNYTPERINELENSRFIQFMYEATAGAEQKEKINLLQEIGGYNFTTWNYIKAIPIMQGPKDTGKSVVIGTMLNVIPERARTSFKLQELSGETKLAQMATSRVNIFPDLEDKPIENTSDVKALSGGGKDEISGRFLYGKEFKFKPYTKQFYSCNKIPPINKADDAFIGRLILIKIDNVCKKKDLTLNEKLEKENDLIFLWYIEGLKRLKQNGFVYTETKESKAIKEKYEINNSTVKLFINDKIVYAPSVKNNIASTTLYNFYRDYCDKNHIPARSNTNFKEELESALNIQEKKSTRCMVYGEEKVTRGYSNILFVEDAELERERLGLNNETIKVSKISGFEV